MDPDPLIGFETESLRFERLLGKGAMGAVYQGVQLGLDRPVAIKVIAAHLSENQAAIARFEREAQTIGKLVHPHVIAAHDCGPAVGPRGENIFLIVLELIDGWSLASLGEQKRLRVRQVLELHAQCADGLAAAHRLGIIHRDIKPDNILVTRSFEAKLADFGLARQTASSQMTSTGIIMGSPAYMSPEACRGEETTPASDIYSLGCSLFKVLTGSPPFASPGALQVMMEHMNAPIPRLADHRPDLAELQPLIDGCLAKNPTSRFLDATSLGKALRALAPRVPRECAAGRLQRTALLMREKPAWPRRLASRMPVLVAVLITGALLALALALRPRHDQATDPGKPGIVAAPAARAGLPPTVQAPRGSRRLEGFTGIAFILNDGRATWGRAGVLQGAVEIPWIEDDWPAGSVIDGSSADAWRWVTYDPPPHSGHRSRQTDFKIGVHMHSFHDAKLPAVEGERFFAYVFLDPIHPPSQLLLQWHRRGSWRYTSYWGDEKVGWGGTPMGPLPPSGQWVRLEVPIPSDSE